MEETSKETSLGKEWKRMSSRLPAIFFFHHKLMWHYVTLKYTKSFLIKISLKCNALQRENIHSFSTVLKTGHRSVPLNILHLD